jgi:hypothetical protein
MMEAALTSAASDDNYYTRQYIQEDNSELQFFLSVPSGLYIAVNQRVLNVAGVGTTTRTQKVPSHTTKLFFRHSLELLFILSLSSSCPELVAQSAVIVQYVRTRSLHHFASGKGRVVWGFVAACRRL